MLAADLVETAPLTPDVGFLPSQPPRSARWLDGCREHWRPELSAVPGPQIGHNFTDAQRLCRTISGSAMEVLQVIAALRTKLSALGARTPLPEVDEICIAMANGWYVLPCLASMSAIFSAA